MPEYQTATDKSVPAVSGPAITAIAMITPPYATNIVVDSASAFIIGSPWTFRVGCPVVSYALAGQ